MAKTPKSDEIKFKVTPSAGKARDTSVRDVKTVHRELMNLIKNSPGTRGASGFSQGGARGRGATAGSTQAPSGARAANPTRHLQRASVRMTFAANKGNGQWKAHGRYIARESATQEAQLERTGEELSTDDLEREFEHERHDRAADERTADDRYSGVDFSDPRRLGALRQSYLSALAEGPTASHLNRVRSLSGIGMVGFTPTTEMLLPGNASSDVGNRGSNRNDALRRGSDGERRTGGKTRGNAGVNGAPGFGSGSPSVQIAETLDSWQRAGDERLFKFILSPEFGDKMDLRSYTKDFVKQLEKDLGTPIEWVGADHYNTEHPHVHLVVRGKDKDGKALRIDPSYVRKTMRERAQQVATNHLGFRTEHDITDSLTKQIDQQRYTELDRMVLKSAKKTEQGYEADYDGNIPHGPHKALQREFRIQQIKRLVYLEQMGLAERTGNMQWRLPLNVEHALRQRQIGNDRLKTLYQHRAVLSDPRLQMHNTDIRKEGRVAGRLIATGLDESNDKPYMLIEGIDGRVHYIYQSREAEKARADGMKTGEFVVLSASKFVGTDGTEKVKIRLERHGDAEALLNDPKRIASEVYRAVKATRNLPGERPYGGWLGKYHRALKDMSKELLDRGSIRPTPNGYEIAVRRDPEQQKRQSIVAPMQPKRRGIIR